MAQPGSVCVYCGSAQGTLADLPGAAETLGRNFARSGIRLVYGGGDVGLMGRLANAALAHGGRVTGIIPDHIRAREVDHAGLTELHIVDDMHQRKTMMVENAEAFVILPGGLGTLDETFEILTWKQLGLHSKPVLIANIQGYWTPLLQLIDHMIAHGFVSPPDRGLFSVVDNVDDIVPALQTAG